MKYLLDLAARFLRTKGSAKVVEYELVLGLIIVMCATVIGGLSSSAQGKFFYVVRQITVSSK